jgi:hypothetical protein
MPRFSPQPSNPVANFLTDVDVPLGLGRLLESAGHAVLRAYHAGVDQATDDEMLLAAVDRGHILITGNGEDFLLLHRAWLRWPRAWGIQSPPPHTGILTLPQLNRAEYSLVAGAIDQLVGGRSYLPNELHAWRGTRWEQL